jgi:predicted RNA-binding protein with PUA domain
MQNEYQQIYNLLTNLGYEVECQGNIHCNGADMAIKKSGKIFLVEVKMAMPVKNRNVLRVRKVEDLRKNDDLIAVVMPSGYVFIEKMKDHLALCNSQGDRFLTEI